VSFLRSLAALLRSRDRRFIELLCRQADLSLDVLRLLPGFAAEQADRHQIAEEVKTVERRADEVRRILIDELTRTYATPFDREDLFALSRSIDDITDAADEAALELTTYGIAPRNLVPMSRLLLNGAQHIRLGVGELIDHPAVAMQHAVRAKAIENKIDSLYHESVLALLESDGDMTAKLKTREVYRHLKNSADRIDRAADDISVIVIKRS
jgi:predicted phosphate transport protein (TIGR00153 family)